MTAMAMQATETEVMAWADGAEWDPDDAYSIMAFSSKITILQHLPCLLVAGGNIGVAQILLAEYAGQWIDFDHMIERLPVDFERAYQSAVERLPRMTVASMIYVGGWSHEHGRMLAYEARIMPGQQPGSNLIQPIAGFSASPQPSDSALEAAGLMTDGELTMALHQVPDFFEVARHSPQRSTSQPEGTPDLFIVGGFLQGASLALDAAGFVTNTRIVRRWFDPLHVPLDPFRGTAAA